MLELDQTYCKRMLEGRIPQAVPAVVHEAELAELAITRSADIGAYVGVPVSLPNGHTYGTLCGLSHDPRPALSDINVDVMRSFAKLIANHLEHDALDASALRSEAESTGLNALLSALTARDHYTGEHSENVVALASSVARHMGLDATQVQEVEHVALLHDIGKVGIPDSILQKHGPLSDEEWQVMHQHPTIGARILAGVPPFAHLAPAVNAEHERFDGTGYPDGLHGSAIPLASRITFACDAYHAITSDRAYRRARTPSVARNELQHGAGNQFDPAVIAALLDVLDGQTIPEPRLAPPAPQGCPQRPAASSNPPMDADIRTSRGSAGGSGPCGVPALRSPRPDHRQTRHRRRKVQQLRKRRPAADHRQQRNRLTTVTNPGSG